MLKKINKKLFILILAGIIIQVVFLFCFIHQLGEQKLIDGDCFEYYTLGKNLLEHQKFSMDISPSTLPESFRTPAYPLFIALILLIYNQIWFVSLVQIILSALNLILIYRLARFFLSPNWALLPCALFILNPFVWYLTIILATETLFLFFLLLSIFYLFKYVKQDKIKYLIFTTLALAISILVRPISYYLFFLIFLMTIFSIYYKTRKAKPIIFICIIFLLGYLLIVLPWQYRNHKIFNSWELSTVQSYNLYFYNARLVYAQVNHLPKFEARQELSQNTSQRFQAEKEQFNNYTSSLYVSHYYKEQALNIIFENPLTYIKLHLIGLIPFFTNAGWRQVLSQLQINLGQPQSLSLLLSQGKLIEIFKNITQTPKYFLVFSLEKIYYLGLFILSLVSIFIWPKEKRLFLYSLLVIILYFALTAGPVATARYRFPIEALILILASFGLYNLMQKIKKPKVEI